MIPKLPIALEDLVRPRTVEGERIEYKAGWKPDAIIPTLCAFAKDFENLGGGSVIIGQDCDEHGQPLFPPVGLSNNQPNREVPVDALDHRRHPDRRRLLPRGPGWGPAVGARSGPGRDQVLRPLLDAGLIEMIIPDKPTSRLQKYRLTAAGLAAREDAP